MPTGTPSISASTRPPTTRSSVIARSFPTCRAAISAHKARAVSIGPGKISGGSVRDNNPQMTPAATRESNLSMARGLHQRRCRKGETRTRCTAARHLLSLCEKGVLVDCQNLAIAHDKAPIDHGIPDVAAARAVNECLRRIEQRHEMCRPSVYGAEDG